MPMIANKSTKAGSALHRTKNSLVPQCHSVVSHGTHQHSHGRRSTSTQRATHQIIECLHADTMNHDTPTPPKNCIMIWNPFIWSAERPRTGEARRSSPRPACHATRWRPPTATSTYPIVKHCESSDEAHKADEQRDDGCNQHTLEQAAHAAVASVSLYGELGTGACWGRWCRSTTPALRHVLSTQHQLHLCRPVLHLHRATR